MRQIPLDRPAPPEADPARLGRLTRHLKARLLDFGPGGPEVLAADEKAGLVSVRFPGGDAAAVARALKENFGVSAALNGERLDFHLAGDTRFEDLDYVWGSLFELL